MSPYARLTICFTIAVSGFAQAADSEAAIAAALQPFRSLQPYRGEFIQNYQSVKGDVLEFRRTILFAGPEEFITQQTAPFPQVNYVAGGTRWRYAPDLLQYTKEKYEKSIDPVESTSLARLAGMTMRRARFLPDETRRATTHGPSQTVITTILSLDLNPVFSSTQFRFMPPPQAVHVTQIVQFQH